MPISVFAAKAASSVKNASSDGDDLAGIHLTSSTEGEIETLFNSDPPPQSIQAGNFSAKVKELAERFFGHVSILNQIRGGEAYIEISPVRSPPLRNSKGFGMAVEKLGLVSEWDGDNNVFKVKVAASAITSDSVDPDTQSQLLYDLLTCYFGVVPEPSDEQVHHLALAIGMNPEELEAELYRIMSVMFDDDADEGEASELAESIEDEEDESDDEEDEDLDTEDDEDDEEEEDVQADVFPYVPAEGEPDGVPDPAVVQNPSK